MENKEHSDLFNGERYQLMPWDTFGHKGREVTLKNLSQEFQAGQKFTFVFYYNPAAAYDSNNRGPALIGGLVLSPHKRIMGIPYKMSFMEVAQKAGLSNQPIAYGQCELTVEGLLDMTSPQEAYADEENYNNTMQLFKVACLGSNDVGVLVI